MTSTSPAVLLFVASMAVGGCGQANFVGDSDTMSMSIPCSVSGVYVEARRVPGSLPAPPIQRFVFAGERLYSEVSVVEEAGQIVVDSLNPFEESADAQFPRLLGHVSWCYEPYIVEEWAARLRVPGWVGWLPALSLVCADGSARAPVARALVLEANDGHYFFRHCSDEDESEPLCEVQSNAIAGATECN